MFRYMNIYSVEETKNTAAVLHLSLTGGNAAAASACIEQEITWKCRHIGVWSCSAWNDPNISMIHDTVWQNDTPRANATIHWLYNVSWRNVRVDPIECQGPKRMMEGRSCSHMTEESSSHDTHTTPMTGELRKKRSLSSCRDISAYFFAASPPSLPLSLASHSPLLFRIDVQLRARGRTQALSVVSRTSERFPNWPKCAPAGAEVIYHQMLISRSATVSVIPSCTIPLSDEDLVPRYQRVVQKYGKGRNQLLQLLETCALVRGFKSSQCLFRGEGYGGYRRRLSLFYLRTMGKPEIQGSILVGDMLQSPDGRSVWRVHTICEVDEEVEKVQRKERQSRKASR